jgi:archaellum component FlaF (FlaF/FlaG flagellin family)
MKKIVCFFVGFVLMFSSVFAQNKGKKEVEQPFVPKVTTGAEIEFDKSSFDYGTLEIGDVKTGIFTFTNVGNRPLVLFDVIVSCDCTEVEWQKEPVMPGKTATIKVVYTAKTAGLIAKQVTIQSNAQTDRVRLQLKGNVKD